MSTLDPDGEDPSQKANRLAARAARFNKSAPGKRNKELENARAKERQAFEAQGLINSGKTELGDAVDMRGTCETMCSPFEMETRNIRMEVHPFERGGDEKLDPAKAVAAYTRSDAGAGHGSSAILPSDLRTPATLVRTLDYLFSKVMPLPPKETSSQSIDRKALGHTAGFIRDRTRAIRKEFAMQSTWGHKEAIASFERIARWHILCLRELQEETGFNSDMHIDSAELGRCFTSLRHLYNDRREESGLEMPCPHEPEMRAYMLIFDLANKSVSIPTSELPAIILDNPLVKLAWEIRKSAQRNFDSQKEGSKLNAELGSNLINRFIRLLKQQNVPFLLSCLVEVRLRDMRRSALRAMTRTYPRLKTEPTRMNDAGEVVERKMVLMDNLTRILGCEEQDQEETAWQDVVPSSRTPVDEAVNIVSKFDLEVWPDKNQPVGSLINLGAVFNDNQDAPYTRRWKSITAKRNGISLVDIVNGKQGVLPPNSIIAPTPISAPAVPVLSAPKQASAFKRPGMSSTPSTSGTAFSFSIGKSPQPPQPSPLPDATPAPTPPPAQSPAKQPSFFDKKVTFAPTPAPSPPPSIPTFSFTPTPTPAPVAPAVQTPTAPNPAPIYSSLPPPASVPSLATKSPTTLSLSPKPTPPRPQSILQPTAAVDLETQRRVRRKILPDLCDMLISEVATSRLSTIKPELETEVKRARAASQHAQAKAARQAEITRYAEQTYNAMLEEIIASCAREAVFAEQSRRVRLCRILRHWRDWAETQREDRKAATLEREEAYKSLGSMGLSSSSFSWTDTTVPHSHVDRLDPFAADVMLHQTERSKDHFYSPSTFLATTARHLANVLQPPSPTSTSFSFNKSSLSSVFQTLISPSKKSATPSTKDAFEWLKSKFYPSGDAFVQDGVTFEAEIMDDRPQSTSVGLMVLEAPLQTWSSEKQRINAADARSRLNQFKECCDNMANEYTPGLLIVTWEDETLDEVVERLDIAEYLTAFDQVATLSLESAEDLDTRFAAALDELFTESPIRQQVIVDLQDAANRMYPQWERLLSLIKYSIASQALSMSENWAKLMIDVKAYCQVFKSGLEANEGFDRSIQESLDQVEVCDTSTYDPIVLPSFDFEATTGTTLSELAEAIAGYLQQDPFAESSDVGLYVSVTRQAALQSRPLPIDGILQSLSTMVLSNISTSALPLRAFFQLREGCEEYIAGYLRQVHMGYAARIDNCISTINRLQTPTSDKTSLSATPKTPSPKTLKRTHSRISVAENNSPRAKEMKALKNAKLLKAMKDVGRTLGSLELEERIGLNGVF